jgi:hypothetical protein
LNRFSFDSSPASLPCMAESQVPPAFEDRDSLRPSNPRIYPVSTVSQPGRRMGELSIELLLEEIHCPADHTHRTVMLDPHLIPRRSTLRS